MNLSLAERRVLVTGAAQGLGLGIARRLVAQDARVVLCDIDSRVRQHLEHSSFATSAAVV